MVGGGRIESLRLYQVSVVALKLSSCGTQAYLLLGKWVLGSPIRDQTGVPRTTRRILIHWTPGRSQGLSSPYQCSVQTRSEHLPSLLSESQGQMDMGLWLLRRSFKIKLITWILHGCGFQRFSSYSRVCAKPDFNEKKKKNWIYSVEWLRARAQQMLSLYSRTREPQIGTCILQLLKPELLEAVLQTREAPAQRSLLSTKRSSERVTGRKARGLQTEEIACKCQRFLSLLSCRRKQISDIFSLSIQI